MQDATTFSAVEGTLEPLAHDRPIVLPRARQWMLSRRAVDIFWKALVLFAITQTWLIQGYKVYGCCMEPNLCTGERLLGSKVALIDGIHRGDVVVFRPPHRPDTAFIKRVIGLPGEVIEIRDSHVYVNNRRLDEPYLHRVWHDDRAPEQIPAHMLFVMGDNRDNSNDSRSWGELPESNVQAKAWLRYWPLNRAGILR